MSVHQCQCDKCLKILHQSDYAVHNEPASPKGVCDCSPKANSETQGFTDKDLAILKDSISSWDEVAELDAVLVAETIEALIYRLEAAEKCVECYGDPQCCMDIKIGNRHEECESYFEWLKSKGAMDV